MTRIAILGGTGYAGASIAREAVNRGHDVVVLSRSPPKQPIDNVRYVQGDAADAAAGLISDADVVVGALAPRGDTEGTLIATYGDVAKASETAGARLIVIGGFGSLRPAPGAPRFAETGDFPEEYMAEITEMNDVREILTQTPEELDWLFVSPAAGYGEDTPGEALGTYRTGGDVALFDEGGESAISGADFATAVVDEIERGEHRRAHIGFGY